MSFSCPGFVFIILGDGGEWYGNSPLPTLPSLESEFHGAMKLLLAQLDPDVSAEEGHLSDIVPGISVRTVTHSYMVTEG